MAVRALVWGDYKTNRSIQGESVIKKLAQGNVPPLLLKNACFGGPQTAFAFLKVSKLGPGWANQRARIGNSLWSHI